MILQPTANPAPSPSGAGASGTSSGSGGLDVAGFIQQARQQGVPDAQIYQHLQSAGALNGQPQAQPQDGAQLHDTGSFLGNVANSAGNLVGGLVHAVAHPIDTVSNLGKTALGGLESGVAAISGQPTPQDAQTQAFHQTMDYFKQRYGSVDNFLKTAYQDPVGTAADASILFTGVGGAIKGLAGEDALLASKGVNFVAGADGVKTIQASDAAQQAARVGEATSKIGDTLNPFNAAGKAVSTANNLTGQPLNALVHVGKTFGLYGLSKLTGLDISTLIQLWKEPDMFSPDVIKNYSPEALANEVKSTIDNRVAELRSTGKEYSGLRNAPGTVDFTKMTPEETAALSKKLEIPIDNSQPIVPQIAKKYGIPIDAEGQFTPDNNSIYMTPADVNSIQKVLNQYAVDSNGQFRTSFTNGNLLNLRQALDSVIPYDSLTKDVADKFASDLRVAHDTLGKLQMKGLSELDAKFAPEYQLLQKAKRDYLNADGTLKDNAPSKIANAGNKVEPLKRLEKLSPGITSKLEANAAVQDIIKTAEKHKVGTYTRAVIEGAGIFQMNPAILVGAILTSPKIASQIIRGISKAYGLTEPEITGILKSHGFRATTNAIKRVSLPASRSGSLASQQQANQ